MFILVCALISVACFLLAKDSSRPWAIAAVLLLCITIIFPPAAFIGGICLVVAIFRLLFA